MGDGGGEGVPAAAAYARDVHGLMRSIVSRALCSGMPGVKDAPHAGPVCDAESADATELGTGLSAKHAAMNGNRRKTALHGPAIPDGLT